MQLPLVPRTVVLRSVPLAVFLFVRGVAIAAAPPAPDPGAFLAGIEAGRLGDDDAAAGFMLRALRADPGQPMLLQPAFLFSTLAGRPEAALLAKRVPPGLVATLVRGNDAARRGDWAAASAAFDTLSGSSLDNAIRPMLSAWAAQGAGHPDRALRILASAGSTGPFGQFEALEAGQIDELAGRTDQAAAAYREATTLFAFSSLATVQAAGGFLVRHGQPEQARAMVDALTRQVGLLGLVGDALFRSLRTPTVADARQGLARSYLSIASMLQQQNTDGDNPGTREATLFMLRFALDLQPDLAPASLTLAELIAAERPEAAIAVLRGVPPGNVLAPLATLRIATLMAGLGRADTAIGELQALEHTLPDRPEPAETLGDVFSDARRYPDAVAAYDRALADRRRLGALSAADWQLAFSRAVALDRLGRWPEARAGLEQALRLSPNQPFVLNYLGYSLVERHQDLPAARRLIQQALAVRPDDGSIQDSLGWVQLRQDDVPGAIHTLEGAAERIPADPTVTFHLGAAYWAAGRKAEAIDQWRRALTLGPEPGDAGQIRDALHRAGAASGAAARPGAAP